MPEKTEIKFCTSCGSDEIEVTGSKYYCKVCDVTYQVSKAGTKPIDTDPLGKHKARLDKVEQDVEQLKGNKPAEQKPQDPGPVSVIDDEEEEEPEGFITVED